MNEAIMKAAGFAKEVQAVKEGRCPFCNKKIDMKEFRDKSSINEYGISGLCQKCQDEMFGGGQNAGGN